jgi:hypothetical protein
MVVQVTGESPVKHEKNVIFRRVVRLFLWFFTDSRETQKQERRFD